VPCTSPPGTIDISLPTAQGGEPISATAVASTRAAAVASTGAAAPADPTVSPVAVASAA
jgi:hypothetical protein